MSERQNSINKLTNSQKKEREKESVVQENSPDERKKSVIKMFWATIQEESGEKLREELFSCKLRYVW